MEATAAMASGTESNSARVTQLSLLVPHLAERLKVRPLRILLI